MILYQFSQIFLKFRVLRKQIEDYNTFSEFKNIEFLRIKRNRNEILPILPNEFPICEARVPPWVLAQVYWVKAGRLGKLTPIQGRKHHSQGLTVCGFKAGVLNSST